MKTNIIKSVIILVLISFLKLFGQTLNSQDTIVKKSIKVNKIAYEFKNHKEKEMKVYKAYLKLYFSMSDKSYPKELLEKDKKEFIEILKGKIVQY
jgi:hypothetical protein